MAEFLNNHLATLYMQGPLLSGTAPHFASVCGRSLLLKLILMLTSLALLLCLMFKISMLHYYARYRRRRDRADDDRRESRPSHARSH